MPTLVCSLEEAELRRALAAAAVALAAELERTDAVLATRLRPMLSEFSIWTTLPPAVTHDRPVDMV